MRSYAFVEYENVEQARAAQAALNGYQLDKAHKFAACLYDEFERLAKVGGGRGEGRGQQPAGSGCLLVPQQRALLCWARRHTPAVARLIARYARRVWAVPAVLAKPCPAELRAVSAVLCLLCRCPTRTRSPASACSPLGRTCSSG